MINKWIILMFISSTLLLADEKKMYIGGIVPLKNGQEIYLYLSGKVKIEKDHIKIYLKSKKRDAKERWRGDAYFIAICSNNENQEKIYTLSYGFRDRFGCKKQYRIRHDFDGGVSFIEKNDPDNILSCLQNIFLEIENSLEKKLFSPSKNCELSILQLIMSAYPEKIGTIERRMYLKNTWLETSYYLEKENVEIEVNGQMRNALSYRKFYCYDAFSRFGGVIVYEIMTWSNGDRNQLKLPSIRKKVQLFGDHQAPSLYVSEYYLKDAKWDLNKPMFDHSFEEKVVINQLNQNKVTGKSLEKIIQLFERLNYYYKQADYRAGFLIKSSCLSEN